MNRLIPVSFGMALILGCSDPERETKGYYAGEHWLRIGGLHAEFPSQFQVYWPDSDFKAAKGWIVRGDSCFFAFEGEGATGLEEITEYLSRSRRSGAVDTLKGKEYVIAYEWTEEKGMYEFTGHVIPLDTAAHRLFAIHPGWYWSPGAVTSCPGNHVSRDQLDSIRLMLKRGFVVP